MRLSKILSVLLGWLSVLLIANAVVAQEPETPVAQQSDAPIVQDLDTQNNRFEGGFLDFNIMLGVSHTDSDPLAIKSKDGGDDEAPDQYTVGALLELGFGYLWGNKFLLGPEINLALGFPSIIGADLRLKMLVPVNPQIALFTSLGWGAEFRLQFPGKYGHITISQSDKPDLHAHNIMYQIMYLPFSLGFEYVRESGFVIGAEMQFRVIFYQDDKEYYYPYTKIINGRQEQVYDLYGVDYEPHALLGEFVIGVHMGYKF